MTQRSIHDTAAMIMHHTAIYTWLTMQSLVFTANMRVLTVQWFALRRWHMAHVILLTLALKHFESTRETCNELMQLYLINNCQCEKIIL